MEVHAEINTKKSKDLKKIENEGEIAESLMTI
jgi:hypothetical protein